MGAFTGLTDFFGCDLAGLARRLHYTQDNLYILGGDMESLRREFPQIYDNIMSCEHNKDSRTPLQYAQDVVASWLFEDYIVAKFTELGYVMELAGEDRERKILKNSRVSSNSDCIFRYGGGSVKVEIMTSYTDYWKKTKALDLRDSKYQKLCRDTGTLLCVSAVDRTFALIDFTTGDIGARFIPSHRPYGGKPAYQIDLSEAGFKPFLAQSIATELIKLMNMEKAADT